MDPVFPRLSSFFVAAALVAAPAAAADIERPHPIYTPFPYVKNDTSAFPAIHLILIGDVSASIDNEERERMLKGYAEALLSKDIVDQVSRSAVYAISLIFFAKKSKHIATEIIPTKEALQDFVSRHLWDAQTNRFALVPDLDSATNHFEALLSAYKLLRNERDYGFESMQRAIVVAGDGYEVSRTAFDNVCSLRRRLSYERGAVIFALPLQDRHKPYRGIWESTNTQDENRSTYAFYRACIKSHDDAVFMWNGVRKKLRPGDIKPAFESSDFTPVVSQAMRVLYN